MNLNTHVIVTHWVDHVDLDRFINDFYGFEPKRVKYGHVSEEVTPAYNFQDNQKSHNDASHEFMLDGKIDDDDGLDLKDWISSNAKCPVANEVILNDLVAHGVAEPGHYIISIS